MMEKNTKDLIWFNDSLFNAKFNTEQKAALYSPIVSKAAFYVYIFGALPQPPQAF